MLISAQQVRRIAKGKPKAENVKSLVDALNEYGSAVGLDQPHRLAHFLAQIMHESGGLLFNKEVWGPTAAQKRYEGRKDLGNTQKGDGSKYRGYGLIQVTGRANVTEFYSWSKKKGMNTPDFVTQPIAISKAPWSAVSALWYWDTRGLNKLADRNDIENLTKRVNGGLNGYADRLSYYDRAALVLIGMGVDELTVFQRTKGLSTTTGSGPITRGALHKELVSQTSKPERAPEVQAAPVVEEKPVVPKEVEKEVKQKTNWLTGIFGTGGLIGGAVAWLKDADTQTLLIVGGFTVCGVVVVLVGGTWLVRRVKAIRDEIAA